MKKGATDRALQAALADGSLLLVDQAALLCAG
jgi:hypothetical protein